jgi:hypothetical protein
MNTQTQKAPAVILALQCLNRIKRGPLAVHGSIEFAETDYQESTRHHAAKNVYRLADGTISTCAAVAKQLELTESRTIELFTRYNNRYTIIHKNHGAQNKSQQFRTPNGHAATLKDLAEIYQYTDASISRVYAQHKGEHVPANAALKEKAIGRARKNNQVEEYLMYYERKVQEHADYQTTRKEATA